MAAMTKAVAELPDDVDALKAMIVAMADQRALLEARNSHLEVATKTADERIATLTAIVRMLERSRYGTRYGPSPPRRAGRFCSDQTATVGRAARSASAGSASRPGVQAPVRRQWAVGLLRRSNRNGENVADDVRLSENLLVICPKSACERTYVRH